MGVPGVDDQADASRVEGECPFRIGIGREARVLGFHLLDCSGGKRSMDDGSVYASLLKYGVRLLQSRGVRYGKYTGETSTALLPSPLIALEPRGR